ncbi:MAG TPA: glycosyltransferase family 87 protein [Verrucomicrobiae bacterium]|nr:glycosyltransferase family 87 protein [Verrucomicrobiae bacterium]
MASISAPTPAWLASAARWLTPRRLHAQAAVLAVCLWGACAVDFATPGLFDRAGNIKFQDFLQFPLSARLVRHGRADELYNNQVLADQIRATVGQETRVSLQYFYGPQVALPFLPLLGLPFFAQAGIWVAVSLLIYFTCIHLLWRTCTRLKPHRAFVFLCAGAYPPLFHFFVRGQLSAVVLVCFTLAYFGFRARYDWLAGLALGLLVFKPQFLVAIPFVLLLSRAWKAILGVAISAAAQLSFAFLYFGDSVMRAYFRTLLHSADNPAATELTLSPIQMHSLYSFWEILLPWRPGVWTLYLVSSLAVIAIAAAIWKSSSSLSLRFSALLLASVLVNPHIYIYDLVALAPALLLLTDWLLNQPWSSPLLRLLLYLTFLLPLFGPLARWTHLQLSVPVFALLLWVLRGIATPGHKLAFHESRVV